jgi:hypothetical protein
MARRKPLEAVDESRNVPGETDSHLQEQSPPAPSAADGQPQHRSSWQARFPQWGDYDAGVHLIEDRQNKRMMIQFDEKPSEAVRALLKSEEHGYRFDGEDQVWYKKINPGKPIQSRQEAEQLAFQVANLIREEKGLEPKKSFSLGR